MKKTLVILLVIILSLGALAGAGFIGFQVGYARGTMATQGRADTVFGHYDRFFGPGNMIPGHGFLQDNRGIHPGIEPHGFMAFGRGRGFGFFRPFSFLIGLALLGLVVWVMYRLLKGNGWQLSMTRQAPSAPAPTGPNINSVDSKSDEEPPAGT